MNGLCKALLIALAIAYIVSPVDLMAGPIDDLIVLLLTIASTKASSNHYIEDTSDNIALKND